jgi:hypothetical protein
VTSFSASSSQITQGQSVTLSYGVVDDVGLKQVELWRADDTAGVGFREIKRMTVSGKSYSGSFSDTATSAGTYRYGIHVVDTANKWNCERNSQTNNSPGQYGPKQVVVVGVPTVDNPPNVTSFSASSSQITQGQSVTLSYSVVDDVGLKQVELWRADDTAGVGFREIKRMTVSGKSYSGSFSDTPTSAGTYRYGVHVVDTSGKWNCERNSQTNFSPGQYGPKQLVVVGVPTVDKPPNVTSFSASTSQINQGQSVTLSYSVVDDVGLRQVELWRADDTAGVGFREIKRVTVSWTSYTGSIADTPTSPGTYRYGLHVVDTTGKWNCERNSQSGSSPGVYGPRQVVVVGTTATPPTISSISPTQVQAGQFTITINGSGFDSGAVDQFYTPSGQYMGSGALSGGLVSRNSNQIVVRENLTGAPAGTYTVRVKNSDGKMSSPANISVAAAAAPTPTPQVVSARIDGYSPTDPNNPIRINVGGSATLSVRFTNIGNTAWKFIAGASVWDSAGRIVGDYSTTLSAPLQPGQQTTMSWNYPVKNIGEYWVQFGVWKQTPFVGGNLLEKKPSPAQRFIIGSK